MNINKELKFGSYGINNRTNQFCIIMDNELISPIRLIKQKEGIFSEFADNISPLSISQLEEFIIVNFS